MWVKRKESRVYSDRLGLKGVLARDGYWTEKDVTGSGVRNDG